MICLRSDGPAALKDVLETVRRILDSIKFQGITSDYARQYTELKREFAIVFCAEQDITREQVKDLPRDTPLGPESMRVYKKLRRLTSREGG